VSKDVQVQDGWLVVDGVKVSRVVTGRAGPCLQFVDKDKRRASRRGSRLVRAEIRAIIEACESCESRECEKGDDAT